VGVLVLALLLFVSVALDVSVVAFVSVVDAVVVVFSTLLVVSSVPTLAVLLLRLSVIYQPEPLNTMPTGWKTRRTEPAHTGHVRSGWSLKD
jgi:hypothetical protein